MMTYLDWQTQDDRPPQKNPDPQEIERRWKIFKALLWMFGCTIAAQVFLILKMQTILAGVALLPALCILGRLLRYCWIWITDEAKLRNIRIEQEQLMVSVVNTVGDVFKYLLSRKHKGDK